MYSKFNRCGDGTIIGDIGKRLVRRGIIANVYLLIPMRKNQRGVPSGTYDFTKKKTTMSQISLISCLTIQLCCWCYFKTN